MFDLWSTELSEEETDKLLLKAAEAVEKRRLSVPAVLALEMHKPLAHIGGTMAMTLAPFLVPFLGFEAVNDYSRLFSKRENVERLLQLLEERAGAQGEVKEVQC